MAVETNHLNVAPMLLSYFGNNMPQVFLMNAKLAVSLSCCQVLVNSLTKQIVDRQIDSPTDTIFVLFNAQVLIDAHPQITQRSAEIFPRQVDNQHVTQIGQRVC